MTRLLTKNNQITVRVSATGKPVSLMWNGDAYQVVHIFNEWKVETRWWEEESIKRLYYQVGTRQGAIFDIYRDDIHEGQWLIGRLWD